MFKRNLALLSAAAILSLSLAGESFAAAGTFKDVSHSVAKDSISVLQAKGIVRGVGADSFLPDEHLTTSQAFSLSSICWAWSSIRRPLKEQTTIFPTSRMMLGMPPHS